MGVVPPRAVVSGMRQAGFVILLQLLIDCQLILYGRPASFKPRSLVLGYYLVRLEGGNYFAMGLLDGSLIVSRN